MHAHEHFGWLRFIGFFKSLLFDLFLEKFNVLSESLNELTRWNNSQYLSMLMNIVVESDSLDSSNRCCLIYFSKNSTFWENRQINFVAEMTINLYACSWTFWLTPIHWILQIGLLWSLVMAVEIGLPLLQKVPNRPSLAFKIGQFLRTPSMNRTHKNPIVRSQKVSVVPRTDLGM